MPYPISKKRLQLNKAFSLIELIVVVAVLAVLAALVIPYYKSFSGTATAASCASNFRDLYMYMLAFTSDHDGKLPPDLGGAASLIEKVDSRFDVRQYWWDSAYLGRYVTNTMGRSRWSTGKMKQHEMDRVNCPNRFIDGPDREPESTSPRISYVMRKMFDNPTNYLFHNIEDKGRKLLLTEGVASTVVSLNAQTGELGSGDLNKRLRRFHNGALNILYMDGRIELFKGEDEYVAKLLQN